MWDWLGFVLFIAFILVLLEYPLWAFWVSLIQRGALWVNTRLCQWWVHR